MRENETIKAAAIADFEQSPVGMARREARERRELFEQGSIAGMARAELAKQRQSHQQ